MKIKFLLSLFLFTTLSSYSTVWLVSNSGTTFTIDTLTIIEGDTVNFDLPSPHNATEVSQATWNANGNTALPGGFQALSGGELVLPAELPVGTHYYVCQPHASMGMKAIIIVDAAVHVEKQDSKALLSVFPNPVKNLLYITSVSLGSSYVIIDQIGQIVVTGSIQSNRDMIDVSKLPSGLYVLQLQNDQNSVVRIVKE